MRATTEPTLASLLDSWVRHLRAANLSPRTIQSYGEAAGQFLDHLSRVAPETFGPAFVVGSMGTMTAR